MNNQSAQISLQTTHNNLYYTKRVFVNVSVTNTLFEMLPAWVP